MPTSQKVLLPVKCFMFLSKPRIVYLLLFLPVLALNAQGIHTQGYTDEMDPVSFIGLTINELYLALGTPKSVFPARGLEEWQDDVVFVYDKGEFYIYIDRVWQMSLKTVKGISIGDPLGITSLLLGPEAEMHGNSIYYSLNEGAWPMMLRFDFDGSGKVEAIFIYRTDF